jgi:DNA-directed RNA polymerase specialized sigma24 family protein
MIQPQAPLAVDACSRDDDPELAAIAARLSGTASSAIKPALKEEIRKECLSLLRAKTPGIQVEEVTDQSQPEPLNRDALILSFLAMVDALLHRYAASAHLDYDDLRQDATLVIMRCLQRKPAQAGALHRYIYVAVRNRIIDTIRYAKRRQAASLDAPLGSQDHQGGVTLADLVPSGYSVDPLCVVLAMERLQAHTSRQRKTQRVQEATTRMTEVMRS